MAVIVLGSINLDIVCRVDRWPEPGETRLAESLHWSPGGKGANQALAARRMGSDTILLGTVGDDSFAIQALGLLRQDGVDLSHVQVSVEAPTGMALITVNQAGQNLITVAPGANFDTGADALNELERWLRPADILVMQCEIGLAVLERALRIGHKVGARVLWDPAPKLPDLPVSLFTADIIVPNQHEAEALLDMEITDVKSAKAAARQLRARGAQVGVVKLGGAGLAWATQAGVFYQPGVSVAVVDTVGAGDAFAGSLAALLSQRYSLSDAIRLANWSAALSTTKPGAQPSFARLREVLDAPT